MFWRPKPPKPPANTGEQLNLNGLSPVLAGMLKACLGKLDVTDLDDGDRARVLQIYNALDGPCYTLYTKGMFSDYGAPVERIKAKPPNPKRK